MCILYTFIICTNKCGKIENHMVQRHLLGCTCSGDSSLEVSPVQRSRKGDSKYLMGLKERDKVTQSAARAVPVPLYTWLQASP